MAIPTTTLSSRTLTHLSQLLTSSVCVYLITEASMSAIAPLILQETAPDTAFQVSNL
jgi:hypothetical protein